jgi:hypothetical protein
MAEVMGASPISTTCPSPPRTLRGRVVDEKDGARPRVLQVVRSRK